MSNASDFSVDRTLPRLTPFGDAALVVEFGDRVDRRLSAEVLALDARIAAAPPAGLVETVPTFRSLLVLFDPLATDADAFGAALRPLLEPSSEAASGAAPSADARLWRLPLCSEGDCALDLAEIADLTGLAPEAVLARHAAIEHHAYMIGFLPGAPYLGDLPPELTLPRRAEPRLRVPAGSVAIAAGLTTIYPVESPGGWRILGRCPAALFDPDAADGAPALIAPGDAVRFEPIDRATFDRLAAERWRPAPERRR